MKAGQKYAQNSLEKTGFRNLAHSHIPRRFYLYFQYRRGSLNVFQ